MDTFRGISTGVTSMIIISCLGIIYGLGAYYVIEKVNLKGAESMRFIVEPKKAEELAFCNGCRSNSCNEN